MYYVFCDDNCKHEALTRAETLEAIEQAIEQGYVSEPESAVFSKIKELNANGTAQIWIGTESQFNAISPAPSIGKSVVRIGANGIMYICTDDRTLDDVNPHAARHAAGGVDEITPYMIGAAAASIQKTVTLSASAWSSNKQTVSVNGVTADNSVLVAPAPASFAAYGEAGVYCSAQTAGKLTFACTDTPSAALTVNILIVG